MYRLQNALTELYSCFIYFALYRRRTIYSHVQIKLHTFVNKYNRMIILYTHVSSQIDNLLYSHSIN